MNTLTLIRLTGFAGLALLVFGIIAAGVIGKKPSRLDGIRMPVLAMEFVESEDELHALIGTPRSQDAEDHKARAWLMKGIRFDYGFIALYWLLFVLIAWMLARRDGAWMPWLGAAAALAITGAALFDVVENVRMTRVIETVQLAGNDVAFAGFSKWLLSFVAIGLLSFAFFGQGGWIWWIGLVCVAITAVGVAGLVALRMGPGGLIIIQRAFQLMTMLLLPLVTIACLFFRRHFTG